MRDGSSTAMLLVGDVVGIGAPGGMSFFLEKAAPELRRAQIVYGNLEFPITDRGQYDPAKDWQKGRRMVVEDAAAFARAGFHVVSVANNHVMDFGPEGLLHTLELLDEQGVAHCGAGKDLRHAHRPAVVERGGVRVAFLAYTSVFLPAFRASDEKPGMATVQVTTAFVPHHRVFEQPGMPPISLTFPNEADLESVRADVQTARAEADVVVVSWHWGVSGGYRKRVAYQMEVGRFCVDAGADIVVGHHPHVLQGVEVYRGRPIFYSLGNFVFWPGKTPDPAVMDRASFAVECQIGKDGISGVALMPALISPEGQPEFVDSAGGAAILEPMQRDSAEFGTRFTWEDGKLSIDLGA